MEICGIDSGVNVCIIKMTLLVDDLELKMPENGGGGEGVFLMLLLKKTLKKCFKPAMMACPCHLSTWEAVTRDQPK